MSMHISEREKQIMHGKICAYCSQPTQFVDSKLIYGISYGMIYLCEPCDAYVGVHKGTEDALGRVANKELRAWKKLAHKHFDEIWKKTNLSRSEAYKWLSEKLDMPADFTHIGMFNVETCKEVIRLSKLYMNSMHPIYTNKLYQV
jgi:hypothetical protein